MPANLGRIAFVGIAVGVVCLGVAMAVGGRSVLSHLDDLDFGGWDGPRCQVRPSNMDGSRELAWNGGDRVAIDVPANVSYQRGQGDRVVVKGDSAVIGLVEVEDGQVRFNCHMRRFGKRLEVTLPGRDFQRYTINGSSDMNLAGIDQPRLRIRINGSGDVTASGRASELEYSVAGSGDGHFEGLETDSVSVSVAGSGDADVAPRRRLEVNIAGSGKVTLHSEPQQLETHIAGSGRIIHTDGSVTRKSGISSSNEHRDEDAPSRGI
jgi:hypothetical protein